MNYSKASTRGSRKYPNKASCINEVRRRLREGLPLNYSAIRYQDDALRRRTTYLFGGWNNTLAAAGLNPEDYRTDTEMASFYGIKFEDTIDQLFTALAIPFVRQPDLFGLRPDFTLRNGVWVDVKLSEWTVDTRNCETVEKYTPHCRLLTIVYLRGREIDRMYANNARLIHVNNLIKQLPRRTRGYFYGEMAKIERSLAEIAA